MGHLLTDCDIQKDYGRVMVKYVGRGFGNTLMYYYCMGGEDADVYTAQISTQRPSW